MDYTGGTILTTIGRENQDTGNAQWVKSYNFNPTIKSFKISQNETYIFFSGYNSGTMEIMMVDTIDGSVARRVQSTTYKTLEDNVEILPKDDNLGIYMSVYDGSNNAVICEFIFSGSSLTCFTQDIKGAPTMFALLPSNNLFIGGARNDGTGNLYLIKVDFGASTYSWKNQIN
mmetsp:Transcript_12712/g.11278  ORF Transcript_12712/g.11278 Transcript_12712/m.11278 type:complete len:173 (+) Transcript_12712:96-614(+)